MPIVIEIYRATVAPLGLRVDLLVNNTGLGVGRRRRWPEVPLSRFTEQTRYASVRLKDRTRLSVVGPCGHSKSIS